MASTGPCSCISCVVCGHLGQYSPRPTGDWPVVCRWSVSEVAYKGNKRSAAQMAAPAHWRAAWEPMTSDLWIADTRQLGHSLGALRIPHTSSLTPFSRGLDLPHPSESVP